MAWQGLGPERVWQEMGGAFLGVADLVFDLGAEG